MILRGTWQQMASCTAIALLLVLWPVLCCCGFNHLGCGKDASPDTTARSAEEGQHQVAAGEHHGASGRCHGGSSGRCHDDSPGDQGPDDGCGCQKSKTQLSSVDTVHASFVAPIAVAALLPAMSTSLLPARSIARWTMRVERPPPRTLSQLRVLRI